MFPCCLYFNHRIVNYITCCRNPPRLRDIIPRFPLRICCLITLALFRCREWFPATSLRSVPSLQLSGKSWSITLCHDATQAGFRAQQRSFAYTWHRRNWSTKNCLTRHGSFVSCGTLGIACCQCRNVISLKNFQLVESKPQAECSLNREGVPGTAPAPGCKRACSEGIRKERWGAKFLP